MHSNVPSPSPTPFLVVFASMSSSAPATRPSAHHHADPPTPSSSSITRHPPLSSPSPSQSIALRPPPVTPTISPSLTPTSHSGIPTSPSLTPIASPSSPPAQIPSTSSSPPSPSTASSSPVSQAPSPSQPSTNIPASHSSVPSPSSTAVPASHGPTTTSPASLPSPSPHPYRKSSPPPDPESSTPSSAPSNLKSPVQTPTQASHFGPFPSYPKPSSTPASSGFTPSSNLSSPATRSSPVSVPKPHKSGGGNISPQAIVGIVVGGLIILAVIGFLIWYAKKRRRVHHGDSYFGPSLGSFSYKTGRLDGSKSWPRPGFSPPPGQSLVRPAAAPQLPPFEGYENGYIDYNISNAGEMIGAIPAMNETPRHGWGNTRYVFTFEQLEVATNCFSRKNLLGEGGFGCVYKGCLPDGQIIAVKQLKIGGAQGEREFQAEVEIIGRVHHRHLVSLVGYCIADSQRLLIYDYVPNGNLEQHLHGRIMLDWATRLKIAVGAARGLAYLHEDCYPQIIHRDIKSSNILLDNNFEARVSDFGLAKLATDTNTHMTTRVVGTFGYLAPEYASSGKLTERSDVYSFGVLLLELVTGRRPVDTSQPVGCESLVEWARPLLNCALQDGNFEDLADPELENNFDRDKMFCMLRVAAACTCYSAQRRPRMGQVVRVLEGDTGDYDLSNGVKPGHSAQYDCPEHSAFVRTFRMMVVGDQEYGSDYSCEYGLNPSVSSSEVQRNIVREGRAARYTRTESHSPFFGSCDDHKSTGALKTCAIIRPHSLMDDNW